MSLSRYGRTAARALAACLVLGAAPPPDAHEIDATGWSVRPPAGFVPAEGFRGAWKPARVQRPRGVPLARNALIRVYSAFSEEACRPACSGEPVPEKKVVRDIYRGRPAYGYQCSKDFLYLGMTWQHGDYSVVKLDEHSCVVMALLARSGEARRQALPAYLALRKTLAPLPKRPPGPPEKDEAIHKKVPLLR